MNGASAHSDSRAGLALAWQLARREMRTGLKGFRVFLACLTLGVAAIAAVGSLSQSVTAGLLHDARFILGGDVSVRQQQNPITSEQTAFFNEFTHTTSITLEMKAMVQKTATGANGATGATVRTLVELKGVDVAYPLVGEVTLSESQNLQASLAQKDGVWGAVADRGVLTKLGLSLGDQVRLGTGFFEIRATILKEPDRVASVLNFGPRFMVSTAALPQTGLVQRGSQIRYYQRALLGPDTSPAEFIDALKTQFPEAGWRIQGPDNAAPGLQRFINRLTLFLTFAGLTALLVGGIGVLGAVRSFLETKTATIATLKCLGAPGNLVFQIYLLQVLALSVIGIVLGLILGGLLPFVAVEVLRDQLPVVPQTGLYPTSLFKAATFGLLISMTFALWPLAQARETPAANLFRTNVMPNTTRPRPVYMVAVAIGVLILGALVVFWAEERQFAYWFVLASIVTIFLLHLGSLAVMSLARHAPRSRFAILRLALANLHRPGTSTPGVVLALGVGLSVLVAVALIQGNITAQVKDNIPGQAPAFFFIDIQKHQTKDFDESVSNIEGGSDLSRMPTMRGRIVNINGVPVDQVDIESGVQWAVHGDRVLTYAKASAEGTKFTAGEWWAEDYAGPPLISFDERVASGFGVGVGDTLTINVLGRDITATIASLRSIDWRRLRFDFAIIFSPGVLESAPQTHIAAIKATPSAETTIEDTVGKLFPNISIIRVRDALEAASRIIAGIGTAITGTASLTVFAGIIVLAGTIAAARSRRIYESVVYKVLGASRRQIVAGFLLEFGLLGLFTGVVGTILGTIIAWAVIVEIMGMEWQFLPVQASVTVISAVAFTTLAGFFGTWRALGEKASSHLRNE